MLIASILEVPPEKAILLEALKYQSLSVWFSAFTWHVSALQNIPIFGERLGDAFRSFSKQKHGSSNNISKSTYFDPYKYNPDHIHSTWMREQPHHYKIYTCDYMCKDSWINGYG